MTVTIINDEELNKLKELCSKATVGDWWIDSHGSTVFAFYEGTAEVVFSSENYHEKAVRHPETGNLSHWRNDWDASYIATASPKRIGQLIARLEQAEAKLKENTLM